jgi:hypothetical protein
MNLSGVFVSESAAQIGLAFSAKSMLVFSPMLRDSPMVKTRYLRASAQVDPSAKANADQHMPIIGEEE